MSEPDVALALAAALGLGRQRLAGHGARRAARPGASAPARLRHVSAHPAEVRARGAARSRSRTRSASSPRFRRSECAWRTAASSKQGMWADVVVFDPGSDPRPGDVREPESAFGRDAVRAGQRRAGDRRWPTHERPAGQGLARCQRDLSRIHEMIITRVGAAALAAGLLATTQQPPTFRTGAYTVAVYATVTDAGGRLVPDLERDQFRGVRQRQAADADARSPTTSSRSPS